MLVPGGRALEERPVQRVRVVVIGVLAEDQPQVPLAGDERPVQAFAAGASRRCRSSIQRSRSPAELAPGS
jgi:hypothetical protein